MTVTARADYGAAQQESLSYLGSGATIASGSLFMARYEVLTVFRLRGRAKLAHRDAVAFLPTRSR